MLAVSLARQSHAKDEVDSLSLAFQHRRCQEEATRKGDEIVATFDDLDVPGSIEFRDKRLGLHAMMAHIRASKQVRRVYVFNISRLARDTLYALELVRELADMKPPVELCSTSENIEDPTILAIIAAMASRERISLSNTVAYAVRESAKRGRVTQQPPFGYRRDDGVLYPDDNAPIVQRIFREYTSGHTTFEIAEGLIRDGIRSPYHKAGWRNSTIRRMLSRRTYIGDIAISETRDPAGRIRPGLVTTGLHEPIIDRATWDVAQRLLASREWVRTKDGRTQPWLSGALVCAYCGSRCYVGVKSRANPDGSIRWYAKCATAQMAAFGSKERSGPVAPLGEHPPSAPVIDTA